MNSERGKWRGSLFSVSEELFWGAEGRMRRWRWGSTSTCQRFWSGQLDKAVPLARSSGCDKKRERTHETRSSYRRHECVLQQLGSLLGFTRTQHHGPPNAQIKCLSGPRHLHARLGVHGELLLLATTKCYHNGTCRMCACTRRCCSPKSSATTNSHD